MMQRPNPRCHMHTQTVADLAHWSRNCKYNYVISLIECHLLTSIIIVITCQLNSYHTFSREHNLLIQSNDAKAKTFATFAFPPALRFMDQVLRGLSFCYIYIDDLLVASSSPEQHKEHLRLIFERLRHYSIIINPRKCKFGCSSVEFLGHLVDSVGIHPLKHKVQVIHDFPQPTSRRQLRTFLGLINFYHRFIPRCAKILQPLNALLSGSLEHGQALPWDESTAEAFTHIKEALATATLLVHPKPDALTNVMTNASNTAVGAVLQQFVDGLWQPISFFSKKLSPAETRYSTYDRELLAAYLALKHLRYFLEGRSFHVMTDHKPLTQFMVIGPLPGKQGT